MDLREILRRKRDGHALDAGQIRAAITGIARGEVPEHQTAALLMAIYLVGLEPTELEHWTRAMLHSGEVLDFSHLERPKVDKHSTGGIGDKVSIPLAPALSACGAAVPMISGRGLGHTGGTLDKLEAIPGLVTELDRERFCGMVAEFGCAFGAQTETLVPADRVLYALRDATGLVESIPLVASSILSKKLAEGIDALVLDVKFGSGAFFPDQARGRELAETMITLARGFGLDARVLQTSMDSPLGRTVGHALEIEESIACLHGAGPADLRELVTALGGELLAACGLAVDQSAGVERIGAALDDGSAAECFTRVVQAQGGDAGCVEDPGRLPRTGQVAPLVAQGEGFLAFRDCRSVGLALAALGGGRAHLGDSIDPAVGVVWCVETGAAVRAGETLAEVHHRDARGLPKALELLQRALLLEAEPRPSVPRVLTRLV